MRKIKEEIYNIPNALSALRLIITVIIIFLIFLGIKLWIIAIIFLVGMITDTLDGQIARRFNQKTKFGAKFDMIADRILMLGTAIAIILYFFMSNQIENNQIYQLIMILSREIIILPILLIAVIKRKNFFPKAKAIGKATTFLQAIALPTILFNLPFSIYIASLAMISGIFSAFAYFKDIHQK